jgi:hypothetical protein
MQLQFYKVLAIPAPWYGTESKVDNKRETETADVILKSKYITQNRSRTEY